MALLDWLRNLLQIGPNDRRPLDWPPPHVRNEWEKIADYRRRYENDRAQMLKADPVFKTASDEKKSLYTPIPLAAEMVHLSSALLFSAEPKFIHANQQDLLDRVLAANGMGAFLHHSGSHVAFQGSSCLRIIRDEEVSDQPLITRIDADQVIWRKKHERFVTGGYVVIERRPNPFADEVFRLIEDHQPGTIERDLYKGTRRTLGSPIPHALWLEEFRSLPERTDTRLDAPTLYLWENVPGGRSDLAGLDALLDRLNEAESLAVDKLRKSVPVTVVDRRLADRQGRVDLHGIVFTGGQQTQFGEGVAKTVETIQPQLQSEEHIRYIEHLREMILQQAGYSLASWGLDDGGSADSGKALRLRQARTLLTKAGKERSAREAIANAVACACAWSSSTPARSRSIEEFRPEIELGDGLPPDLLEDAQEIAIKRGAAAISLEQAVRELHPDWAEDVITAEVERIHAERGVTPNGV